MYAYLRGEGQRVKEGENPKQLPHPAGRLTWAPSHEPEIVT